MKNANWDLTLPLPEARKNNEIISLASSQILRWIDELNGIEDGDAKARAIREEIVVLKKEPNSAESKREMRKLYAQLDKVQFKEDYINIIMDRKSDYKRLCKGFKINGIPYKRLLGTNNGIKNSTIVFVSERLHDELFRRIENGRDKNKKLNPAKLEAYRALTCSASVPVSMPEGVLVVEEYKTEFFSDVIYLANQDDGEPIMEERKNELIKLNAADGFGLMCPALAERWSQELGLDYVMAGANTRMAFNKGMVFTFDFHEFASEVAGSFIVKDAWGFDVDIRDVELILNTSMVKLWSSYGSCDEYLRKSISNHYGFGIAKVTPKELENERTTNYQFIQTHNLNDSDIKELISPTMNEIRDVLGGDWRKTILFLRGINLSDSNVMAGKNDWIKAIMVDHDLVFDPYIRSLIFRQIKNRINEAKIGVLKVHGNYSIVSGDPFAFCQHIFGLEVTGLLKAGEIYNKYWSDYGAEKVVCFRAPMSCHNNIRLMEPSYSKEASYWFYWMNTCTILNVWDTTCAALNGMDFDGDLVMISDNSVLVNKLIQTPAIMCEQKSAPSSVPSEQDIIQSNIDSFGNEIGRITNYITSMYEVASKYPVDSDEYVELQYRIKCGQLIQQDAIDAAKGIIAKPMPLEWHDSYAVGRMEDGAKKDLYRKIVADRKPYFMKYIYPTLSKQYSDYVRKVNMNALRQFGIGIDELLSLSENDLSEKQKTFIEYYIKLMPVGNGDCVMNKICHLFEDEFDGKALLSKGDKQFDYGSLSSGSEYTSYQRNKISSLFNDYTSRIQKYVRISNSQGESTDVQTSNLASMRDEFLEECSIICPNEQTLYDIIIDIAGKKTGTKKFVWDICGDTILENLLRKNNYRFEYPCMSEDGDVSFGGYKFETVEREVVIY